MSIDLTPGGWMERRRKVLGLTQAELATRVGYNSDTIRKIEKGVRHPSKDGARQLAVGLEIPPELQTLFIRFATAKADAVPPALASLLPIDTPSSQPPPPPIADLPAATTSFIGRAHDIATLQNLLERRDVRLVTLVGPPGIGKTRLALEVASASQADFKDGVYFVALAPVRDHEQVIARMAEALDVQDAGSRTLLDSVIQRVRGKEILLLLDNFEQVIDAAVVVDHLLKVARGLKVLVTSREALRVDGEHKYKVRPLALPPLERATDGDAVPQHEAVRLFVERAQAVEPDFALTAENALAVARICSQLEGLPLAIELAAARIEMFAPAEMLAHLEHRLDFLRRELRVPLPHHQTMSQAIAWSYHLLSEAEKTLFRRLAVFRGGCTRDAARMVCNPDHALAVDVFDVMESLLDKSLVQRTQHQAVGSRFWMLEIIREYAGDQRGSDGEAEAMARQHATYFLALAEQAETELRGPEATTWLNRLEIEHDNLRAALRWAIDSGETEIALQMAGALGRFWLTRGYWSEGRRWLAEILAKSTEADAVARVKALHMAGVLAWSQSDYGAAHELHSQSLAVYEALGDTQNIARTLNNLGYVASFRRDYEAAHEFYQRSLSLYEELGDEPGMAASLDNLGQLAWVQGDYELAQARHEASLRMRRASAQQSGARQQITVAQSLINLGNVSFSLNDYETARQCYTEGYEIAAGIGDKLAMAVALRNLGDVALVQERLELAATRYTESLSLYRELGDKLGIATGLAGFMAVAAATGEGERAARLSGAAQSVFDSIGSSLTEADQGLYTPFLAAVQARLGEQAWARSWAMGNEMSIEKAIGYAFDRRSVPSMA